jgi:tungstate transport system substrate-binding protein
MRTKTAIVFLTLLLTFAFSGLSHAQEKVLRMATTTSTDNTGLLDVLAPLFKKDTGIELQWVAVGTGKALELGKNCDVDVLLVHAPSAEKKYVEQGYGINRREIMYNDFVIIGPKQDPAGIKGLSVTQALVKLAEKKAPFVSRGDNSGTNKKEKKLWKAAGISNLDKEPWYIQTGQGMLATINVAVEREGYTLTDRGTYIKYEANMKGNPSLVILIEGDKELLNQYSVLEVNPERCKKVKNDLAKTFSRWMASPRAQKAIGDFRLLGKQLFTPNAKTE